MFDLFSWSHILILLGVALVVVGPKDLPRLMHMVGKWAGKARAMANEFKTSFDEMARQQELDQLRTELEALRTNQAMADIHAEINAPVEVAAVETGPEPRVGEFQVTDTAPEPARPVMAGGEPHVP